MQDSSDREVFMGINGFLRNNFPGVRFSGHFREGMRLLCKMVFDEIFSGCMSVIKSTETVTINHAALRSALKLSGLVGKSEGMFSISEAKFADMCAGAGQTANKTVNVSKYVTENRSKKVRFSGEKADARSVQKIICYVVSRVLRDLVSALIDSATEKRPKSQQGTVLTVQMKHLKHNFLLAARSLDLGAFGSVVVSLVSSIPSSMTHRVKHKREGDGSKKRAKPSGQKKEKKKKSAKKPSAAVQRIAPLTAASSEYDDSEDEEDRDFEPSEEADASDFAYDSDDCAEEPAPKKKKAAPKKKKAAPKKKKAAPKKKKAAPKKKKAEGACYDFFC